MSTSTASELSRLVQSMQKERQQHADAIAQIDATFAALGIAAKTPARRGRKPGAAWKGTATATSPAAPKKRRGRRAKAKDGKTGEEYLVSILQSGALTTAEINKGWTSSGRNGRADILLGKLVAGGKLKRQKVKGERGSRYSVA